MRVLTYSSNVNLWVMCASFWIDVLFQVKLLALMYSKDSELNL